jgi:dipeptidyl aminopeptidase/acylaminoacyl peptidase
MGCGLPARTDARFRLEIATAGIYDLLSVVGQTDVRRSHLPTYDPLLRNMIRFWRIEDLPHVDAKPYLDASPIMMVSDVSAPLLLKHGDLDYVPIQQSEEIFLALRSAGKEAEFVRYWGVDQMLGSPANMRDFWSRLLAWLEAHRVPQVRA